MSDAAQLAILGSYPPPYGGVGVHVRRLCPLLEERGITYRVYNATSDVGDGDRVVPVYRRRKTWLLSYLFTARETAVYILSGRLSAWIIGALLALVRGKKVLLRLRNADLVDWAAASGMRKRLAGFALRRMTGVVCVSELLRDTARRLGVAQDRLHYSPGFLPPDVRRLDRATVSARAWEFIERHEPIIAANGKAEWYKGEDLYGLDMLVELAARLKRDFPKIGVVVCFWEHRPSEDARLTELKKMADDRGAADNILFNTESGEFVPVLAACDVFVRPTNTDGDANSIREALYLGVPAVVSDAVERPAGAILFRSRDHDDFEQKVRGALASAVACRDRKTPAPAAADRERIDRYLDLLARVSESEGGNG